MLKLKTLSNFISSTLFFEIYLYFLVILDLEILLNLKIYQYFTSILKLKTLLNFTGTILLFTIC